MDSVQESTEPLPQSTQPPTPRPRRRWKLPLTITIISTAIAIIWALSDTGRIDSHWGALALIFFTWLAVVLGTWALSYAKEQDRG